MRDVQVTESLRDASEMEDNSCESPCVQSLDHSSSITGARVGVLVGITDEGCTPLVMYPGQKESAALVAASIVDLSGAHVGRNVVLMFENGDPTRPIVMGCLWPRNGWPIAGRSGEVQVDIDGNRLLVTAKEELVLRCGSASITLTKAGKVLIRGKYLVSESSGLHRIKGGSVQIN